MKYCYYCGTELNDDDAFCMNCGRSQDFEAESDTNQTEHESRYKAEEKSAATAGMRFKERGHNVLFTKSDLSIDEKTYKYTKIRQIKHSSHYKAYLFKYNDEWVKLLYEDDKTAEKMRVLFGRISAMNARNDAKKLRVISEKLNALNARCAVAKDRNITESSAPAKKIRPENEITELEQDDVIIFERDKIKGGRKVSRVTDRFQRIQSKAKILLGRDDTKTFKHISYSLFSNDDSEP